MLGLRLLYVTFGFLVAIVSLLTSSAQDTLYEDVNNNDETVIRVFGPVPVVSQTGAYNWKFEFIAPNLTVLKSYGWASDVRVQLSGEHGVCCDQRLLDLITNETSCVFNDSLYSSRENGFIMQIYSDSTSQLLMRRRIGSTRPSQFTSRIAGYVEKKFQPVSKFISKHKSIQYGLGLAATYGAGYSIFSMLQSPFKRPKIFRVPLNSDTQSSNFDFPSQFMQGSSRPNGAFAPPSDMNNAIVENRDSWISDEFNANNNDDVTIEDVDVDDDSELDAYDSKSNLLQSLSSKFSWVPTSLTSNKMTRRVVKASLFVTIGILAKLLLSQQQQHHHNQQNSEEGDSLQRIPTRDVDYNDKSKVAGKFYGGATTTDQDFTCDGNVCKRRTGSEVCTGGEGGSGKDDNSSNTTQENTNDAEKNNEVDANDDSSDKNNDNTETKDVDEKEKVKST